MWIRKKIEIGWLDLAGGLVQCCLPGDRDAVQEAIRRVWNSRDLFTCLSIRSGFDLLLNTLRWEPGSEIIMSGLTIRDMPRIVEQHGLVPIGIDLDPQTLAPSLSDLEQAITPRTKAIVIAHLFGGLCDLDGIAELARRHQLLLIEDCAQAYVGNHDQGDPRADVSMFSFGPIKTNTALAGAIFRVRKLELLAALQANHARWPRQSRWSFAKRIFKYTAIAAASTRWGLRCLVNYFRWRGRDHDQFVAHAARGFAGPGFFQRIRQRPSIPLLRLLLSRLQDFDPGLVVDRQQRGLRILSELAPRFLAPGAKANRPTFWVLTLLVDQPQRLVEELWRQGFDATHRCSMEIVGQQSLPGCQFILDHLVFLPFDPRIPDGELQRLVQCILTSETRSPSYVEGQTQERTEQTLMDTDA
jgi:dTDP-4-amino-4,6-dideoxygalactose transaminase